MSKPYPGKNRTFIPVILVSLLMTVAIGSSFAGWLDRGKEMFGIGSTPSTSSTTLTVAEIGSGLKEALRVGSERVVGNLGRVDGFNADPEIHIPLPEKFRSAQSLLAQFGMSGMLDDLELQLNRAAEAATPKAKELFLKAIEEMTLEDVKGIYNGPDDAATRYFQRTMSPELAAEMRPVVDESLSQVGAIQTYNQMVGKARSLPFAPDIKTDLSGYVIEKGMDGIFHYLALEEAAIRRDPAERTTEILKKVFGGD